MNLCPVSDTGVPTFVETDTVCAEGVPKVGVLGLLLTAPTLRRGTVILPAEEVTWKERTLSLTSHSELTVLHTQVGSTTRPQTALLAHSLCSNTKILRLFVV